MVSVFKQVFKKRNEGGTVAFRIFVQYLSSIRTMLYPKPPNHVHDYGHAGSSERTRNCSTGNALYQFIIFKNDDKVIPATESQLEMIISSH